MNLLLIAIGGGFGALGRYLIGKVLNKEKHRFPLGTWVVNTVGTLLLASTYILYNHGTFHEAIWALVGIGFCGAFTTFSTFSQETVSYLLEHEHPRAFLYVGLSVASSLLIAYTVLAIWL
ncbi:chromosome condensation protein CrcB [Pontibacillus halophilus JSM 076056 = DSM 19796]|uniref:Fluoride-specific ion channel FluC n=1 Tax=Pontibacillus halophilus JSM 076056 = DSM 19796 TaxID=1385510 RepID=A0A0A5GHW4_9BACI|nr:CrcB family protein [Pontibacillus halophilus]KGX92846.1 chromosome condensation protein CrcB [Pontibacillus halophilus JSM 076056 = DSM 19796]